MLIFLLSVQAGSFIVACLSTLAAIVRGGIGAGAAFLTWLAFVGLFVVNGMTYGLSFFIGWWALAIWASLTTFVVSYVTR